MYRNNDCSSFDKVPKTLRDLYLEALSKCRDVEMSDYQMALQRFAEAFEADLQRYGIPLPENIDGNVVAIDEKSGKRLSS